MFKKESIGMSVLKKLGFKRLAWSLRRLHCPVNSSALVLDVGSGGNPYPRANVLLDAFEDTIERYNLPLIKDRPLVFGLAERMPFKDKSFDFVVASHVLEHSSDPDAFINELVRVGRAGYIETPDAFFERINPFRFHRLEVTDVDGKLIIYKKDSWRPHAEWVDMYERKMKDAEFLHFLKTHAEPFYVRYYWSDSIPYEVMNPAVDCGWDFPKEAGATIVRSHSSWRYWLIGFFRRLYSQNKRNRQIDLIPLLRCPTCFNQELKKMPDELTCPKCNASYSLFKSIPLLYPANNQVQ